MKNLETLTNAVKIWITANRFDSRNSYALCVSKDHETFYVTSLVPAQDQKEVLLSKYDTATGCVERDGKFYYTFDSDDGPYEQTVGEIASELRDILSDREDILNSYAEDDETFSFDDFELSESAETWLDEYREEPWGEALEEELRAKVLAFAKSIVETEIDLAKDWAEENPGADQYVPGRSDEVVIYDKKNRDFDVVKTVNLQWYHNYIVVADNNGWTLGEDKPLVEYTEEDVEACAEMIFDWLWDYTSEENDYRYVYMYGEMSDADDEE